MKFPIRLAQCAPSVVVVSALMLLWLDGRARAADRQSLINQFPSDVQPLLTSDIPDDAIAALLKVRNARALLRVIVRWASPGRAGRNRTSRRIRLPQLA